MDQEALQALRYPIGLPQIPAAEADADISKYINTISRFPALVRSAVADLSEESLSWRYRPEGWSIRQVIHHCADSHMNGFIRSKLALTERNPKIKPYLEGEWAKHPDALSLPVEVSLKILEGVHERWTYLLVNLEPESFNSTYKHPEAKTVFTLYGSLAQYDWHCRHHLAHIHQAIEASGKHGVQE